MGPEFHLDGRADMTKLRVVFRDFANGPEKLAGLEARQHPN